MKRTTTLTLRVLAADLLWICLAMLAAVTVRYGIGGGDETTGSVLRSFGPELVSALLLFSYPLHPPGKPERLRTEHFSRLRVPALFVHGTTDPFGTIDELRAALTLIPAQTRLIPIEGAGHDLRRGRFDFETVVTEFLKI